jgi:hypothetical protein
MATLRTQLCAARQVAFFDPELNPRAVVGCILRVGDDEAETTATVVITERLGKSHQSESTGIQAVTNAANILISKADVAELPEVMDGFRGTCETPDGTSWQLGDIQFQDDALFRVKAMRTVVSGAGKYRARPWGG